MSFKPQNSQEEVDAPDWDPVADVAEPTEKPQVPKVWKAKFAWKKVEGTGSTTVDNAPFKAVVQEEDKHKDLKVKTDPDGGVTVTNKKGLVVARLQPNRFNRQQEVPKSILTVASASAAPQGRTSQASAESITSQAAPQGGTSQASAESITSQAAPQGSTSQASAESITSQGIKSNKMGKEFQGQVHRGSSMFRLAQTQTVKGLHEFGTPPAVELMLKGMTPPDQVIDLEVVQSYCTCCLGRGWQLRLALPVNLATTERFLFTTRFCVALFHPTELTLQRARANPDGRLQDGTLSSMVLEIERDFQETKAFLLEHCQSELGDGRLVVGLYEKDYFESSKCKNEAHKLGLMIPFGQGCFVRPVESITSQAPAESITSQGIKTVKLYPGDFADSNHALAGTNMKRKKHVLVNLDADNILGKDWPLHVDNQTRTRFVGNDAGFRAQGEDSGVTGRVGASAQLMLRIGGYDESFLPTGYQDIDLYNRMAHLLTTHKCPRLRTLNAGWSIPNTTEDQKKAVTTAKTRYSANNLTWGMQNDHNRVAGKAKMLEGRWWRNSDDIKSEVHSMWKLWRNLGMRQDWVYMLAADPGQPDPGQPASITAAAEPSASITATDADMADLDRQSLFPLGDPTAEEHLDQVLNPPPPRKDYPLPWYHKDYEVPSSSKNQRPAPPHKAPPVTKLTAAKSKAMPSIPERPTREVPKPKQGAESITSPQMAPPVSPPPAKLPHKALPPCFVRVIVCGAGNLQSVIKNVTRRDRIPHRHWNLMAKMANIMKDNTGKIHQPDLLMCLGLVDGLGNPMQEDSDLICIDCRDTEGKDDPEEISGPMKFHLGFHPENMINVARRKVTRDNLLLVRRHILTTYALNPESSPGITVVAYCRGGNHRSVAFSQLLQRVLQTQQMISCPDTEILFLTEMAGFWRTKKCDVCNLCRHQWLGQKHTQLLEEAFELAQQAWESFPDEI